MHRDEIQTKRTSSGYIGFIVRRTRRWFRSDTVSVIWRSGVLATDMDAHGAATREQATMRLLRKIARNKK